MIQRCLQPCKLRRIESITPRGNCCFNTSGTQGLQNRLQNCAGTSEQSGTTPYLFRQASYLFGNTRCLVGVGCEYADTNDFACVGANGNEGSLPWGSVGVMTHEVIRGFNYGRWAASIFNELNKLGCVVLTKGRYLPVARAGLLVDNLIVVCDGKNISEFVAS